MRPPCPKCGGLLKHEPATSAGPERVYCVCGWSLYRPDQPAVVVEKQVEKQEAVPVRTTQKHVGNSLNHVPDWVAKALALKTLTGRTTRSAAMSGNTHHTLGDLNDRLFSQLDRISDGNLTGEKLKGEIDRTRAIAGLAKEMIDNAKLVLEAERVLGDKARPGVLSIESK